MRLFLVRGSHMDSKPFKQHLYLKAQLRQEQLQFVRNELSLASTFLDVAEASQQREGACAISRTLARPATK